MKIRVGRSGDAASYHVDDNDFLIALYNALSPEQQNAVWREVERNSNRLYWSDDWDVRVEVK